MYGQVFYVFLVFLLIPYMLIKYVNILIILLLKVILDHFIFNFSDISENEGKYLYYIKYILYIQSAPKIDGQTSVSYSTVPKDEKDHINTSSEILPF